MADKVDPLMDEPEMVEAYRARSPSSFPLFVRGLTIPSAYGPKLFSRCIATFQDETFQAIAPSIHAVRDGAMPSIRRFWLERTKKAAKDSDIGACLLWLAAFPTRPLYIQVGAADRDQAAIVRRRIKDLLYHNPWLNDFVDVQQYKILNKGRQSEIDIMAADIPGSHGETPDLLVINELSHVTKWEFIENLMDNADGVPRGVIIVATNAGFKGSKAEVMRNNALTSKNWCVKIWDKPAPWIGKEDLLEAKNRNTLGRFNRLWRGQWASGKGDALDESDIERCFKSHLQPLIKPEPGWRYIGGLDLGVSHDHAGLTILGINVDQDVIRVARLESWEPAMDIGEKKEVDLSAVENACLSLSRLFGVEWFGYDPAAGGSFMAQRLRKNNVPMREVTFVGKNLTQMAETLVQVIESGRLECFEDNRLRRDFGKFNVVEKSYGYRLEAVSDEYGHADVGTALAICLPKAASMFVGGPGLSPEDVIAVPEDDAPLTDEEIKALPDELRGIYEIDDDLEKEYRRKRYFKETEFPL